MAKGLEALFDDFYLYFKVGNIPYETTEEQLREIFSAAGPVVSFR